MFRKLHSLILILLIYSVLIYSFSSAGVNTTNSSHSCPPDTQRVFKMKSGVTLWFEKIGSEKTFYCNRARAINISAEYIKKGICVPALIGNGILNKAGFKFDSCSVVIWVFNTNTNQTYRVCKHCNLENEYYEPDSSSRNERHRLGSFFNNTIPMQGFGICSSDSTLIKNNIHFGFPTQQLFGVDSTIIIHNQNTFSNHESLSVVIDQKNFDSLIPSLSNASALNIQELKLVFTDILSKSIKLNNMLKQSDSIILSEQKHITYLNAMLEKATDLKHCPRQFLKNKQPTCNTSNYNDTLLKIINKFLLINIYLLDEQDKQLLIRKSQDYFDNYPTNENYQDSTQLYKYIFNYLKNQDKSILKTSCNLIVYRN